MNKNLFTSQNNHLFIQPPTKGAAEAAGRGVSLWRCYLRAFWRPLVAAGFCKLLGDMLAFLGPLCISRIIHYVEETSASVGQPTASLKPLPRVGVRGFR